MPNPTITAYAAPTDAYAVGGSDVALYDVELTDLSDPAEFIVTAPDGAEVHVWTLFGPEATVRWNPPPAPASAALLTGGTWQSTATVGSWSLSIGAGAASAPHVVTVSSSGSPSGGMLRVRVRGIRATNPAGTATVQAQFNAATRRIVADPSITGTPGPAFSPVLERTPVSLVATVAPSVQQGGGVPAAFGPLPPVRGAWTRTSNQYAFMLAAVGDTGASFLAPGVSAQITETFDFRAYLDLDASGSFTAGEPDNVAPVSLAIEPARHRMVAVIDRSGSMWGGLSGSTESRWDGALRAAHIWLDLFSAFRSTSGQQAGFITFEHDGCNWNAPASPGDIGFVNPATGAAAAGLTPLGGFSTLNGLNLGSPGSCTPIGDALVKAFDGLTNTPLTDLDLCSVVLLTDGRENSGLTSFRSVAPAAGVQTINQVLDTRPILKSKLKLFAIGAGTDVDEDALNDLPALPSSPATAGYFTLTGSHQAMLTAIGQMLGNSVDAQDMGAVASGTKAAWQTNSNEHRMAVVVPWAAPPTTLELRQAPQGGGAMSVVPIGPGTGVTLHKRATHGILIVDLPATLGAGQSTSRSWEVSRVGGPAEPINTALAMVDLHLRASVTFDKTSYRSGDAIVVSCSIVAGSEPVTAATVTAEPEQPEQGLGTYLAVNGAKLGKPVSVHRLGDSRAATMVSRNGGGADPASTKGALLDAFLREDGLDSLPRRPGIFEDGTDHLYDDGAHGDGDAGNGVYANRFTSTAKEGTYTFRFRAEGELPDGSRFSRVITVSTWVGVRVDPASSPVQTTPITGLPAGTFGQLIAITPRSAGGEFLGPFREWLVDVSADAGTFDGPVESRIDGSYVRRLIYKRGEDPNVTVTVDGVPVKPGGTQQGSESCRKLFLRLLRCLLRKLRSLVGR